MQRLALEVSAREGSGKGVARKLRASGLVPAIVYGTGLEPVKVQVPARALEGAAEAGANALIELEGVKQLKGKLVLIKESQRDPVSRRMLHCDFYAVDLKRKIHVAVPLRFEGRPIGVEMGGVLEPLLRELEVSCLPLSIPDSIACDVSELQVGSSLRVSDLVLPEEVELLVDESLPVVHVVAPRVEEEEVAAEEEAEAAAEGAPEGEAAPPAEPAAEKPGE